MARTSDTQQARATGAPKTVTLRVRLVILLLAMLLPFAGLSFWQARDIYADQRARAASEALSLSRLIGYSIDDYIESTEDLLVFVAGSEAARTGDFAALQTWFSEMLPSYPHFMNIIFVGSDGIIRAAGLLPEDPSKPVDVSDTVYFQRSMEATGLTVGDFMLGKISGNPVVHVCYPVYDTAGARTGFVAAAFSLTRIQDRVIDLDVPSYMTATVVDQNGIVVARSDEAERWVGTDVSAMFDLPRMRSVPEGTGELTLADGRSQLSSYTTVATVPWHVRCSVENTHVLQEVQASIERQLSVSVPLFLLAFAGFLWIGRDLDQMHRHTRRMALSDGLTGLSNIRQLEQDLHRAISAADRTDRPVSFIMLDLDNFKQFNDLRGHRAGDAALKAAAAVIKDAVRGRDACYRYGGEEFCVLLPDTDADGAYSVAERIRRQIAASEVRLADGTTAPITVSAGVATYPVNSNTAEDLINCSDAALYRAKDQGRNTVCICHRTPGAHPIG